MNKNKYKTDDIKQKALNIKKKNVVLLNIPKLLQVCPSKKEKREKILPTII